MGITAANITNPSVSFSSLIPKETCLRRPHFGQVTLPYRKSSDLSRPELPIIRSVITAPAKETPRSPATLARVWREIQGSRNWEGLVGPLDPLLQREIIRYAEFVNACYKAFDFDPNSKRHLNCKYGKRSLLREVGLEKSGYEVTKYVYVTPDITVPFPNATTDPGRWVGYVAVSSDNEARRLGRRDVLLTFRGTVTPSEWIANFMSSLTPARLDPHHPRPDVKVESGFLNLYTTNESRSKFGLESCREQLLSEISRLINKYKGEEVSITVAGHSMGSALGLLFAYDVTELGLNRTLYNNREIPITVISFGGPRVGNSRFKERCEELGVKVLRIVNANDPITKLPGMVLNDDLFRVLGVKNDFSWRCSCYAHVGVEVVLDFFTMQNPSCVHDLEFYIRLLKGVPNKEKVQSDDCAGSAATDHLDKARQWFNKNKGSLDKLSLPSWSWESAVNAILHLVYSQLSI